MGYKLEKHEPYIITGKDGKEYKIHATLDMDMEEIDIVLKFNKTEDELEKTKLCKEFLLHACPELEKEGIGDMEYFNIFMDYDKSNRQNKKDLGES